MLAVGGNRHCNLLQLIFHVLGKQHALDKLQGKVVTHLEKLNGGEL